MSEYLFQYHPVHPTTWVYLSSLLMICIFFKFGRLWSVRNLDLVLLAVLAPGLLLVHFGDEYEKRAQERQLAEGPPEVAVTGGSGPQADPAGGNDEPAAGAASRSAAENRNDDVGRDRSTDGAAAEAGTDIAENAAVRGEGASVEQLARDGRKMKQQGFIMLLGVGVLFLIRLLVDPTMVRRPLLEPNLSTGGLTFMGVSLFVFLMANVVSSRPTEEDLAAPRSAEQLLAGVADEQDADTLRRHGPGNAVLHLIPKLVTTPMMWDDQPSAEGIRYVRTAKVMAILSHLAVVVGMVLIGYRHFGNVKMGIGAATLYLMLPYTAMMTGRVLHVLPAALFVWMVLCYRRPLLAGMFTGLAIGVVYYPLFLLPLWISFYWQRGLLRFLSGMATTLTIMALSLLLISDSAADYIVNFQALFGIWWPRFDGLMGVWGLGWDPIYRIPVLAAFIAISGALAIWPAQKNLGTLLSCSAAIMVATQFWHGFGGGLFMAWYLPLALLTVFRPNLEDRVALTVLGESWFPRRRHFTVRAA